MKSVRFLVLVPFAASILACGGSSSSNSGESAVVSNKKDAAGAAYSLQNTNEGVRDRGRGLSPAQVPGLDGIGNGGVNTEQKFTVSGAKGTAEVTAKVDISTGAVGTEFTVKYNGYSSDGETTLDGEVTHIVHVAGGENTAEVSTELRGAVSIEGKLTTHLEMNVTTRVSLSGNAARVEVDGMITADGQTYNYNDESFDLQSDMF